MQLWHGSPEIVRKPLYGYGKKTNDYGQGFYCTEHEDLAREWACVYGKGGFANRYDFDMGGLHILNLNDEHYTVLNWLALLTINRIFTPETSVEKQGLEYLKKNFLISTEGYDVIRGYRADDSYFQFARAFVSNAISVSQLSRAMRLGSLGEQIVLVSREAYRHIHFKEAFPVDYETYSVKRKQRDEQARASCRLEAMNMDINGLFIRDIIREGVSNNDVRIRS